MRLCRFYDPIRGAQLGIVDQQTVYNLSSLGHPHLRSLTDLLQWSCGYSGSLGAYLTEVLDKADSFALADLDSQTTGGDRYLLKPIEHQEVWAAGVTYERSLKARRHESKGDDIYDRIYTAERPEIFLKATPHRVVGNGETLYIRGDSRWMVPEPELAILFDPALHVIGYTVGNDLSARDIEGENPLYLAQAKIFGRCCAVGPTITLAEYIGDVTDVKIELGILRGGDQIFAGEISTARMTRSIDHLAEFLGKENDFPDGVFLLTGTGIVPPDDFTLEAGDRVVITIEGIGTLSNDISHASH